LSGRVAASSVGFSDSSGGAICFLGLPRFSLGLFAFSTSTVGPRAADSSFNHPLASSAARIRGSDRREMIRFPPNFCGSGRSPSSKTLRIRHSSVSSNSAASFVVRIPFFRAAPARR
jgi:hypothetical protein